MFSRLLRLPNRSFFLFGPRGVGKSTFLRKTLPEDQTYIFDLLDYELEDRLSRHPKEFCEILKGLPDKIQWILVDEVQKLPFLLDEVHRHLSTENRFKFCLTGSSARKLKRGKANLLAGRAFSFSMHPLTSIELKESFDLENALNYGTLPEAVTLPAEDKVRYLRSYVQSYLREEIQLESIVRNLPSFRRFLYVIAHENGNILNFSNISREIGIDSKTVQNYFQILEDTLIGFYLPAWHKSVRKQQLLHPKFYLFDTGVHHALIEKISQPIVSKTSEFGKAFEHFWISEYMRLHLYWEKDYRFYYLATHSMEVDLVIEKPNNSILLIEFKATHQVSKTAIRSLINLYKELPSSKAIVVCLEPRKRVIEGVILCPWQEAIAEIFE